MSKLSKSPVVVARRALYAGQTTLRPYAHKFSPKVYTQPQLFACLVLKVFFKTDYRGLTQLLHDLAELRDVLALEHVPHYTTLHKASQRLLTLPRARRLLTGTMRRLLGRRRRVQRAAFDSTGMDCGHRSHYYVRRRSKSDGKQQKIRYSRYANLEAGFDCRTHMFIAAIPRRGPAVDTNRFVPLLEDALRRVGVD